MQLTSSLVDAQHPSTLGSVDSSVGYYPSGGLRKVTLGNGLTETAAYNNRLQPCRMNVNSTGGYYSQCTDMTPSGNVLDFKYGFNAGTNNGNITSWSATGNQTFSRTYTYDSLNRIATMADSAKSQSCKGLSWTIDRWGNRTDQTVTSGKCNTFHQTVNSQNQFPLPFRYDAAGNMINDGTHSYTYDAENRLIQVDSAGTATYTYDPEGRRVAKTISGTTTDYVHDLAGNVLFEAQGSSWVTAYIYFAGALKAQYKNSTTYFLHRDHLGSTRLVTGVGGTIVDKLDFLPFGGQIAGGTSTTHKFTSKERDAESGLDYFGARYFSAAQGRLTSPDPGNVGAYPRDPQSWNAYAYTGNNPLSRIDPDGLDYSVCTTDENGGEQCTYVANDQSFEQALANPGAGISISGDNGSGTIYTTDANGNQVEAGTYQHFVGPGEEGGGLQQDYGAELGFLGLFRGIGSLFGGAAARTAASTVWDLGWATRGGVIEQMLGANLPRTFPVIDAFENGVATSIKSIDLRAATYQAPDALASKLTGYVDKLEGFSGGRVGDVAVDGADVSSRVLKLAVPAGGVSSAQQAVINSVAMQAAQRGVSVVVVPVR
jgi:RHS repeat-associated protein